jgi:DNA (cytosine-5)-methyltransferase 1
MRIGSLFSGAGGLDMAVENVFGGEVAWHCEVDPAASKVLAYRYPHIPNLGDITKVDWAQVESVDVLCGGFPCQDISSAGKRAGMGKGTRSGLWSEFARAIDELRPSLVVIENVRNLLNVAANRAVEPLADAMGDLDAEPILRGLGAVLGDLSDLGFDADWATVSAAAVGACHLRERVFAVAYPAGRSGTNRLQRGHAQRLNVCAVAGTGDRDSAWSTAERVRLMGTASAQLAAVDLLPSPSKADGDGGHLTKSQGLGGALLLPGVARAYANGELLSTPQARDYKGVPADGFNTANLCRDIARLGPTWGKYELAVRRWEGLTRPHPSPTKPNSKGNESLSPTFSEWMLGWPAGWVTDVPGLTRTDQLRVIGNGVVPQQAKAAIRYLLSVSEVAA